ncbi:MAG: hypothetical protein ACLGH4_04895, partial [Actinomycetes bacterium]
MSRYTTSPPRSRRALRLSGAVTAIALVLGMFTVGVAVADSGDGRKAIGKPSGKLSREAVALNGKPSGKLSREAVALDRRPSGKLSREAVALNGKPSGKLSREAVALNGKPSG